MKRLFLFIALFSTAWAIKAQSIGNYHMQWETTIGLNVSNLGGLGSRTGFHIGARAEFPLLSLADRSTYLNTGVLLSLKGCSQDYGNWGSAKVNPYYLDVPIHFGYKHAITRVVSVFAEGGPYVGIGLFGKSKIQKPANLEGSTPEEYDTNIFTERGLKRFDFGLGFRIGAELWQRYSVSLGYDWGLINQYRQSESIESEHFHQTSNLKNRNLTISLSYKF